MAALVPVLLAGGVGSRLWPTSREIYPKQLLNLTDDDSLLQHAARRALDVAPADRVITVTTEAHYFPVLDQLRAVDERLGRHVIVEPMGRNTAAAVGIAALYAEGRFDSPILWAAPTDHVIRRPEGLPAALARAAEAAARGRLVTFGVAPDEPDSGLGYIRRGQPLEGVDGAYDVAEFVEKPAVARARRMLAGGDWLWNSGMFVFSAATLLGELERTAPDVHSALSVAVAQANPGEAPFRVPREAYGKVPSVAIDKAVMERSKAVAVIPVDLDWSDIGSWHRLWQVCDKDAKGNVSWGDVLMDGTRDSLVRADHRLVACSGVQDLVVVETADAVLVANRHAAADVRRIVERLARARRPEAVAHLAERRPWGSFEVLLEGARFKVKEITVNPGASLSLQMHHRRSEHWVVIEGTARVTCGEEVRHLGENESAYIPLGAKHRLENPGEAPLRIVEVQCGDYVGEDDIVRCEDRYDRHTDDAG